MLTRKQHLRKDLTALVPCEIMQVAIQSFTPQQVHTRTHTQHIDNKRITLD